MRKALLVVILLSLAAFAGWTYYSTKMQPHGRRESLRLATIETGSVSEQVTAQGKLEAKEYVDVGTQVSGQIQKIHVQIGDQVKAGDLLVEIDPRIYETRVAADQAHTNTLKSQVTEQAAALTLAQQQYNRNMKLIKTNAVSHDDLEQSAATLKAAEAKLASLKAQVDEAQSALDGDKTNLAYTKINAPIAGTVVDMPLREGQTVNASQTAPTILKIANLDIMTVRAQVAEADIPRLHEGMTVYFTTMGQPERKWTGTVRQILPTPEIINDVVLYDVLIDTENKDHQLMSSMSCQVFFVIGAAKDVPLIPVEALNHRRTSDDSKAGMAYGVRVATGQGKPEERLIHIGYMDRTNAEIRDGLEPGEQIVLPPLPQSSQSATKSGGGFRGPRL
jgi:macrolide-specific efflux system membrane fusion protein